MIILRLDVKKIKKKWFFPSSSFIPFADGIIRRWNSPKVSAREIDDRRGEIINNIYLGEVSNDYVSRRRRNRFAQAVVAENVEQNNDNNNNTVQVS